MQDTKIINGLNTIQMYETIAAIKNQPEIAKFQFRSKNQWIGGGENRSTIKDFYGGGQEDTSRREPFVFVNGEPPILLGNNEGANPVEFLLHALAGCVTTTLVLQLRRVVFRFKNLPPLSRATLIFTVCLVSTSQYRRAMSRSGSR